MECVGRDELLGIFVPIAVYWVYSGIYMLLGSWDEYRLHPRGEEDLKNSVTKWGVVKGVLLQQSIQVLAALIMFTVTKEEDTTTNRRYNNPDDHQVQPALLVLALQLAQFGAAMVILDTWQYFMHRMLHLSPALYRHVHSKHHDLVVPYAIGALYNHPLEGLLLDTCGGGLAYLLSGMTPRAGALFFSLATVKTVDDHCGLLLPGNPVQRWFANNSAYHSVHHQLSGQKCNFSQPFFVVWDRIFGTYVPYSLERRQGGQGIEVKPVKQQNTNNYLNKKM